MARVPDEQPDGNDTARPPSGSPAMQRPQSETPPEQERQPAPTFPRWMFGVGAAVIVFAVIWVLVNLL